MSAPRVVEKFYSPDELASLVGFNARWWRDKMKAEPVLKGSAGEVISACVEIGGQLFAPASWVNGFLARHAVEYNPGIKARNRSDLERCLRRGGQSPAAVAA